MRKKVAIRKTKNTKISNEDPSINFRLPEILKDQITRKANIENKTVSNYLRDHLEKFVNGSLHEKEVAHLKGKTFKNSTEFLQLVAWVFAKRSKRECKTSNQVLNRYIETIKRIDDNLPLKLREEFDKVLFDLMKVRNDDSSYRSFIFCEHSFTNKNFDYQVLEDYLLNPTIDYIGFAKNK